MVSLSGRRWEDLEPPLSPQCVRTLRALGFKYMTAVQSSTIPYFMQNKDVAVEAVTGSGKTLAFAIPVVEILLRRTKRWSKTEFLLYHQTGSLIIAPTRELAMQTAGVLHALLPCHLSQAVFVGGHDLQRDIHLLLTQGAQVVVGTPGRLADLLTRADCPLASAVKTLEVLVLDEADRLLELGFQQSISTILRYLPKQRQTGLFSATLNAEVKALVRAGLRNPLTITVRDKHSPPLLPTPHSLTTHYLVCTPQLKFSHLLCLLKQLQDKKVLVFFATCASVSYFAALTKRLLDGVQVSALHGKMHSKRQQVFSNFSDTETGVLMCTDVMARGVDFPNVHWVIQFDPPSSTNEQATLIEYVNALWSLDRQLGSVLLLLCMGFVHRCGRTARMGQTGQAVVMLLPCERPYVEFLELNQHISVQPLPSDSTPDPTLTSRARDLAARERELYESGLRAFVSFVHFYYKHECKLIFQPKKLDLVALAKGFALPHLPRMPELKRADTSDFVPHSTPPSLIPFKNKAREKARQAKLAREAQAGKKNKKPTLSRECPKKKIQRNKGTKRKRNELSDGELEELAREARLLKKYKAGKISKTKLESELDDP